MKKDLTPKQAALVHDLEALVDKWPDEPMRRILSDALASVLHSFGIRTYDQRCDGSEGECVGWVCPFFDGCDWDQSVSDATDDDLAELFGG